jgi:hypothetical protein
MNARAETEAPFQQSLVELEQMLLAEQAPADAQPKPETAKPEIAELPAGHPAGEAGPELYDLEAAYAFLQESPATTPEEFPQDEPTLALQSPSEPAAEAPRGEDPVEALARELLEVLTPEEALAAVENDFDLGLGDADAEYDVAAIQALFRQETGEQGGPDDEMGLEHTADIGPTTDEFDALLADEADQGTPAQAEAVAAADHANLQALLSGFGGYATAREFAKSGSSFKEMHETLAASHSPLSDADFPSHPSQSLRGAIPRAAIAPSHGASVPPQTQQDLQPMSLISGIATLGAKTLYNLANLTKTGSDALIERVHAHRFQKQATAFNDTFEKVEAALLAINDATKDSFVPTEDLAQRKQGLQGYIAGEDGQANLQQLVLASNDLEQAARALTRAGINSGKDEDEIFGMTASRIADLTERNRQLLEAIDHNGKTLLERFDSMVNNIFKVLGSGLTRIARMIQDSMPQQKAADIATGPAPH